MKQRIITAVIALLALLLVLFYLPEPVALVVIVAVMLGGAWEWSAFLGTTGNAWRVFYVVIIGALIAAAAIFDVNAIRVFQVSLAWWVGALVWTFFFPTPIPVIVRWLSGALVLVPLYLALTILYQAAPELLLFALLIVWVADTDRKSVV